MRRALGRLFSAVALIITAAAAAAHAPLNFNDLVGKWNLMYEDGQTGTVTFSKNPDGTPKAVVSTMAGGESVAKEVVIKGDTITITREINVQGAVGSVVYTARLVEGALKGAGAVTLADMPVPPTPFTATRAK